MKPCIHHEYNQITNCRYIFILDHWLNMSHILSAIYMCTNLLHTEEVHVACRDEGDFSREFVVSKLQESSKESQNKSNDFKLHHHYFVGRIFE